MASNPFDKLNTQLWPSLADDVHPDVRRAINLLYDGMINHRRAFAALRDQQLAQQTINNTVISLSSAASSGGAGSGDVKGPPASIPGDVATYADASGKQLADSNILLTDLATKSGVQQEAYTYAVDTGAANAYAISQSPAPTLVAGSEAVFIATHANTGASTLAVNGGSAIAIKKMQGGSLVDPAAGDIAANQIIVLVYDGTVWQLPSGMVFPGAGIPISTGSGWGTSIAETDGNIIYGASGAWTKGTALPNGITATTQATGDATTKVATDAFVSNAIGSSAAVAHRVPAFFNRIWGLITPGNHTGPGVGGFTMVGDNLASAGTLVSNGWQQAPFDFWSQWNNTSGTSTGSHLGHFGDANWRVGKNISFSAIEAMGYGTASPATYNNMRYWVGLTDSIDGQGMSGSATPNQKFAAFRFDTSVPDSHYICCCSNGGGTSADVSTADSGVAPGAGALDGHLFRIEFNDSVPNVTFYIDGVQVGQLTTKIPATNTLLRAFAHITTLTNTNGIRQELLTAFYTERDF